MRANIWRTALLHHTLLCCWAASARAARWDYRIHVYTIWWDSFSLWHIFMPLPHLCFCPFQINVTTVREHLPKGDFSIMTEMLKKFLSFMNLTVSMIVKTGLLSFVTLLYCHHGIVTTEGFLVELSSLCLLFEIPHVSVFVFCLFLTRTLLKSFFIFNVTSTEFVYDSVHSQTLWWTKISALSFVFWNCLESCFIEEKPNFSAE